MLNKHGNKMKNVSFITVAAILAIIAVVCNMPQVFDASKEAKVSNFPKEIGQWRGEDIPIPERDYAILETRNLIMREYKNPVSGESVMLYIIYSAADNRRALHPPEICYTGAGAAIAEKSVIPVTGLIKANKFIIKTKNSSQLVIYWFKSAGLNTDSYLKQQMKMVTDAMLKGRATGAMIRVSCNINNDDEDAALEVIREFCGEIEPLVEKYVP
jgi:EpsI family protein